jgi:hypothetical protein
VQFIPRGLVAHAAGRVCNLLHTQNSGYFSIGKSLLTAEGLSRIRFTVGIVPMVRGRMSQRQSRQNQLWLTSRKPKNSNIVLLRQMTPAKDRPGIR